MSHANDKYRKVIVAKFMSYKIDFMTQSITKKNNVCFIMIKFQ